MADYKQMAADILAAVGGKDNVTFVTHCMTRLRFTLKDNSIPDRESIKKLNGVMGCQDVGSQLQIIVGQSVPKVYKELCTLGDFAVQEVVKENLDGPKEKMTVKKIFGSILDYLSASMVALIPILLTAGLVKSLCSILGPDLLGLITVESDLYKVLDFVYDAGFYFLPIYLGYTAAKKIGVTPVLGMLMGAVLISPDFMAMSMEGAQLAPLGISMTVANYSQSALPILLTVWVMSYVEKFFKKIMPDMLNTIFTPFLTVLVMVPVSLYALAPLGGFAGNYIGAALTFIADHTGFIGVALFAVAWDFLVMTGMHVVVATTAMVSFFTVGYDQGILLGGCMAGFACWGMGLGAALIAKSKQERADSFGMCVTGMIGGVGEPLLFGIGMKYIRPFLGLIIGAALGGAYAGLTGVKMFLTGSSNILIVMGFLPGGTANVVNGVIACIISLVAGAVATVLIGLEPKKKKIAATGEEAR